jgi:tetratricopeptide (TPR) repeat protein
MVRGIVLGCVLVFLGILFISFDSSGLGGLLLVVGVGIITFHIASPSLRFQIVKQQALEESQRGNHKRVLQVLKPVAKRHAADPQIAFLLGYAYNQSGDEPQAEVQFRRYHELEGSAGSACVYAETLRKVGKSREAVSVLQGAAPAEDEAAVFFTLLGSCFIDLKDTTAAIEALKRGPLLKRNLDDDLLKLHYTLGVAYQLHGDRRSATKEFERVRAHDADYQDVEMRLQDFQKPKLNTAQEGESAQ